jgi:hypothetical protein
VKKLETSEPEARGVIRDKVIKIASGKSFLMESLLLKVMKKRFVFQKDC